MIDTHSHVLYGLDDGAKTAEESMQILQAYYTQGIHHIITTSHAHKGKWHVPCTEINRVINHLSAELKRANIPITLHTGHEITIFESLVAQLEAKQLYTLANSRYVLVELPSTFIPHFTLDVFQELFQHGYVPIIAHPERNQVFMDDPNRLEDFIRLGVFTQITTGSIVGSYGQDVKHCAWDLLDRQLIHLIGSDVHDSTKRMIYFEEAKTLLHKKKKEDYFHFLKQNNERLFENEQLIALEPTVPKKKKWWHIL